MLVKDSYNLAVEKIKAKKIVEAIEILKNLKSFQGLKLLGMLNLVKGNYQESYAIFKKLLLVRKDEDVNYYFEFIKNNIEKYNLDFNKLLKKIKNGEKGIEIDELFKQLEEKFTNEQLLELKIIYLLKNFGKRKAYPSIKKLETIDKSNIFLKKLKKQLEEEKEKRNVVIAYFLLFGLMLTAFLWGYLYFYREKSNLEEKIAVLEKIKTYSEVEKENLEINASTINLKELFSENEIYNFAITRIKEKKYKEAINFFKLLEYKKFPEYKAKEIVFHMAYSYEKIGDKEKALDLYNIFFDNYNKVEYEDYLKIVKKKIRIKK